MSKIKSIIALIKKPGALMYTLAGKGFFKWMPDKSYLNITYKLIFKKNIDWVNPITFNEKLQWLKIYDRNGDYTKYVDKYEVKKIVSDVLGIDYIIPTIGVWDDVNEINWDNLPHSFVLKCTHDSGSVIICKDKNLFNKDDAKKSLEKHLKQNPYWFGREWPYKNVKPRIIAEQYLEEADAQLKDYKFLCFNGKMKCCFVFSDRYSGSGVKLNVYDKEWKWLPISREYTKTKEEIAKPKNYELMICFAEKLAKSIPFVRVDFYEVCGKLYFGEMTFYPNSGFTAFKPESWDSILGDWLRLPIKDC